VWSRVLANPLDLFEVPPPNLVQVLLQRCLELNQPCFTRKRLQPLVDDSGGGAKISLDWSCRTSETQRSTLPDGGDLPADSRDFSPHRLPVDIQCLTQKLPGCAESESTSRGRARQGSPAERPAPPDSGNRAHTPGSASLRLPGSALRSILAAPAKRGAGPRPLFQSLTRQPFKLRQFGVARVLRLRFGQHSRARS